MENDIFFVPNKFADPVNFIDPIPVGPPDPYGNGPLPPIWLPPAPIDDDPVKDPVNGNGPAFRSYLYSGTVRDAYTEQPLPGATVTLYAGGKILAQQAANGAGVFQMSVGEYPADSITISEVSHKTYNWPASEAQHVFDLEPEVKDLPPVVIIAPPGAKKNNLILWAIAGLLIAKSQKWI